MRTAVKYKIYDSYLSLMKKSKILPVIFWKKKIFTVHAENITVKSCMRSQFLKEKIK